MKIPQKHRVVGHHRYAPTWDGHLHKHSDRGCPTLWESTHPIEHILVEYDVEWVSFRVYNVVETFERYSWGGD